MKIRKTIDFNINATSVGRIIDKLAEEIILVNPKGYDNKSNIDLYQLHLYDIQNSNLTGVVYYYVESDESYSGRMSIGAE